MEINTADNEIVLCESESLFTTDCFISNVNYMSVDSISKPIRTYGKIRYSHKEASCIIKPSGDGWLKCTFDEPQRAITPRQAAVFDHILCGGTIERLR